MKSLGIYWSSILAISYDIVVPDMRHCVKSVQIRSFLWSVFSCIRTEYGDLRSKLFSPNTGKYRPEKTPYLDTFHVMRTTEAMKLWHIPESLWECYHGIVVDIYIFLLCNLILSTIKKEKKEKTEAERDRDRERNNTNKTKRKKRVELTLTSRDLGENIAKNLSTLRKKWRSMQNLKHMGFGILLLIFLPKTLNWNKITFLASNLLNLAELVLNELMKSFCKKITNIPFSFRLITA